MANTIDSLLGPEPDKPERKLTVVERFLGKAAKYVNKAGVTKYGFKIQPVLADGTLATFADHWIAIDDTPEGGQVLLAYIRTVASVQRDAIAFYDQMVAKGKWPARPVKAEAKAPAKPAKPAAPPPPPASAIDDLLDADNLPDV